MRWSRLYWSAVGLAILAAIAGVVVPNASISSDPTLLPSAQPSASDPALPLGPAPLLATGPATANALFPNLVDNGDLEAYFPRSRPRLWDLDPDAHFLWDEASRGPGDRSLFLDAATLIPRGSSDSTSASPFPSGSPDAAADAAPTPSHAALRYPIPSLRPGAAYIVSLWMARDPNIDGLYPSLSLGGREFRLSDLWASGSWQKISLVVLLPRLLPPDARHLEIRIPAGDYRLWIDDLAVRRLAIDAPPANESGPVVFSIPSTDRLLDVRLVFSRRTRGRLDKRELRTNNVDMVDGADGPSLVRGADLSGSRLPEASHRSHELAVPVSKTIFDPPHTTQSFQDERADDPSAAGVDRFSIEREALAAALPSGRWKARVEIYQHATLLDAAALGVFTNRAGMRNSSTLRAEAPESTSAAHTAALDPFPIGIFGARIEDFAALADAGFNAAFFSASDPAQIARGLAQASRNGLSLLVPHAAAEHILAALASDTRPNSRPDSRSFSRPGSDPPPAPPLYFYLDDEPEGRSISPKLLFRSRAALRRLGFGQPGAIALCRSWRAADYASAVDVFMSNPYPVPFEPLSWLAQCLDEIRGTVASGSPDAAKRVWAVIQAFGWDSVSDIAKERGGRLPTPEELKALVRLALLHGAEGLFFYSLRSGEFDLRNDGPLWSAVKEAIVEARALKPLLDAPLLSPAPTVYCPSRDAYGLSAVHFKAVRDPVGGKPVVIALNTLDRPVQAALRFPGQAKPVPFALDAHELKIIE